MKATAILTQIKSATATFERAIINAEDYPKPSNKKERDDMNELILSVREQAEKFPTKGTGSSIRKALRQVANTLEEKL